MPLFKLFIIFYCLNDFMLCRLNDESVIDIHDNNLNNSICKAQLKEQFDNSLEAANQGFNINLQNQ